MITFRQVKKTFKRTDVLKGVDLKLNQGDRIALVGSNGAGKTTLIRCLLGEYNCEGDVLVGGKNPREHRSEVLSRIGFVPQLPPPLKMPVGQLLKFSSEVCSADMAKMENICRRLGLEPDDVRHRPFVRLSGGQKQKLLISIALGRDADILILDEPAANLDPEARHRFFELLAKNIDNSVMLISSHRLDEVSALVNRVVEMDQGKIVLDDRVEDNIGFDSVMNATIEIARKEPAFEKAILRWGFSANEDNTFWQGEVAGPDRLRFLGVISRYAGLVTQIQMTEKGERILKGVHGAQA